LDGTIFENAYKLINRNSAYPSDIHVNTRENYIKTGFSMKLSER
jgi:hypothetical protein